MTITTIPPDLVPPEQRPTLERLHQELRIYPWFVQLNKKQNDHKNNDNNNINPQNKLLLRALSYFQCRNCNTYSQDFFPEDEHYHDGTLVYARCHYCCRRRQQNSKSTTRTNNNHHHHRTKHPPQTTTTTSTSTTTTPTYMVCILCAASSLSIVSTTTTTMGGITTAGERSIQKFLRVHVGSKVHLKNRNKYNIDASESSYPLLTYPDCRQFGTMPIFKKRFSNNIVKKNNNIHSNNKGNGNKGNNGDDTIHDDDENVKDMNGTSFNSSGMMDGTDSVTSDISESSSGSEEEEEEEEESSDEEEEESSEEEEEEEEEESMAASSDGDEELNNERDYLHDDDDVTDDDDDEEDSMKEEQEQPSSFTIDKAAKESSVPPTTTTSTAASSNCSSGDVDFENIDLLNTEHGQEEGSSSLRRIPVQVREEFVRYKFELLKLYSNTELLSEVERRMQK